MIMMMIVFIAVPLTPHSRAAVFLGTGTKSSLKASYDDDDNDDDDDDAVDDDDDAVDDDDNDDDDAVDDDNDAVDDDAYDRSSDDAL